VQLVRRGGGSLDLKCYCLNALTDEGMRALSSFTALTFLDLGGLLQGADAGSAQCAASLGAHVRRCNTPV
jgi:hypothetical protein